MTNRPKQIGTRGESAVVRVLREHGFPCAERRALHGIADMGDVAGIPGIVIEVKAGAAAREASLGQIATWLDETNRERINARADIGILVVQRSGYGPERARHWTAWIRSDQVGWPSPYPMGVSMSLAQAIDLLRFLGHGDPS